MRARMVKRPSLAGSPDSTANVEPLGRPGGPAIHFRLAGLICAGAALPASSADMLIMSSFVIGHLPVQPPAPSPFLSWQGWSREGRAAAHWPGNDVRQLLLSIESGRGARRSIASSARAA